MVIGCFSLLAGAKPTNWSTRPGNKLIQMCDGLDSQVSTPQEKGLPGLPLQSRTSSLQPFWKTSSPLFSPYDRSALEDATPSRQTLLIRYYEQSVRTETPSSAPDVVRAPILREIKTIWGQGFRKRL